MQKQPLYMISNYLPLKLSLFNIQYNFTWAPKSMPRALIYLINPL